MSLFVSWWLVAGSNYSSGTLATTWGSQTDANRAAGQVNFFDSTSNEYYITGVQLEVGENATPFEHITYAEELTLCERYYQELPIQDRTFVQYSYWKLHLWWQHKLLATNESNAYCYKWGKW